LNQQVSKGHRWQKGQSGNPAGRAIGARQKISEKLLADLASVWETHGESVLERLALTDPGKLATIAYGLLPRDLFISVQQQAPGGLDAESWASLRRVLDLIESCGASGEPQEVFEMIEEDLRARLAKSVEST
jgi:Family of unknown function (DUF5681)